MITLLLGFQKMEYTKKLGRHFFGMGAALVLTGCGGGGGEESGNNGTPTSSELRFVSWNGSVSGPWVYLRNGIVAFTQDKRQVYDYDTKALGVMGVDASARVVNADGSFAGAFVVLAANGLGTQSAIVRCSSGAQARIGYSGSIPYIDCTDVAGAGSGSWGNGTGDIPATSGGNTTGSTGAGYQWKSTSSSNQCVSLSANSLTSFITNKCGSDIWVTWYDDASCKNGCAESVQAYSKDTITKVSSNGWRFASCVLPGTPHASPGVSWKGSGDFYCLY